ncbi:DUF2127 domain-containing protein [Actinomycetospora sp. C-140]
MQSQASADGFVRPPGTGTQQHRSRLCFELLSCAWNGHVLIGTDAASVTDEDALIVRDAGHGARAHRCLRCDAWILLPAPSTPIRGTVAAPDEVVLPTRGRPLKSRVVLRLIALTRAFNVLVLLFVLGGVVAVLANRTALRESLVGSAASLQEIIGGQTVAGLQSLLSRGAGPLWLVAAGVLVLLVLEAVEGIGLWRATCWGQYLSTVLTTMLLVPQVLQLSSSASPGTIIGIVINVAVVVYLLVSKRLFGLRGGAPAEAAEIEHDVSWDALARHLPGGTSGPGARNTVG